MIVRLHERLKREHNIEDVKPINEDELVSLVSDAVRK